MSIKIGFFCMSVLTGNLLALFFTRRHLSTTWHLIMHFFMTANQSDKIVLQNQKGEKFALWRGNYSTDWCLHKPFFSSGAQYTRASLPTKLVIMKSISSKLLQTKSITGKKSKNVSLNGSKMDRKEVILTSFFFRR